MKSPTHRVKFYGVSCFAYIDDDSFELIGRNKVTQWLLDVYSRCIFEMINFTSWFCALFNVDYIPGFKLYILEEIKE